MCVIRRESGREEKEEGKRKRGRREEGGGGIETQARCSAGKRKHDTQTLRQNQANARCAWQTLRISQERLKAAVASCLAALSPQPAR